MKKAVKDIIGGLKSGKFDILHIPDEYEEYCDDIDLIKYERKSGLRRVSRCGYDVIRNQFFVEDEISDGKNSLWHPPTEWFDDFSLYNEYLDGQIYENACYYKLNPRLIPSGIDYKRLSQNNTCIEKKVDEYSLFPTAEETERYAKVEKNKPRVKQWLDKFYACSTADELEKTIKKYQRSTLYETLHVDFFLWNYIFNDLNSPERFQSIIDFVASGTFLARGIEKALCSIYKPEIVVEKFYYYGSSYQSCKKHVRNIKQDAVRIKNNEYKYKVRGCFDSKSHYFYVETRGFLGGYTSPDFSYREYFEHFDEFARRLHGDIRHCDLSAAQDLDFDFSNCIVDGTTKLPPNTQTQYTFTIDKYYFDDHFYVILEWKDETGKTVKSIKREFEYFCDFVSFLNGDLSHAFLFSCHGLKNINDFSGICLSQAEISDTIYKKLVTVDEAKKYLVQKDSLMTFPYVESNEQETSELTQPDREIKATNGSHILNTSAYSIGYVSDIHLLHKIQNEKCLTELQAKEVIFKVAQCVYDDDITIINGDISSDFKVFEYFIKMLKRIWKRTDDLVFTLGNHELWDFPGMTIQEIVLKYHALLADHGMHLLHNSILYRDLHDAWQTIETPELEAIKEEDLRKKLRTARLIIFGGIGFSGYNPIYNADIGLYRKTIDREIELEETKAFEKLYNKICHSLYGMNVVIASHMPLPNWCHPESESEGADTNQSGIPGNYFINNPHDNIGNISAYQPGFVYISGHTHRNYYYDDGDVRIFADNQFGYGKRSPAKWPHLKHISLLAERDFFMDYEDGIHEITAAEYRLFNELRNQYIDFNRDINVLYMLKKNGFYCFIHKSKNNSLCILNGGALKKLQMNNINYYYDNMDLVISMIKKPLNQLSRYQKKISDTVRKLGGSGYIHGCIVDIDFFNHIYINPADNSLTAYWAENTVNKIIYPSIPALLKEQCPDMYIEYEKLLEQNNNLPSIFRPKRNQSEAPLLLYLDTDIYIASRKIKKMQKLYSGILSIWPDNLPRNRLCDHN